MAVAYGVEVNPIAMVYNDHISRLHERKKGGWLTEPQRERESPRLGLGRAEKHVAGDVLVTTVSVPLITRI